MKTTYFQLQNKFYQQKDGMAIGSLIPPVARSIFVEYFEKMALDKTGFKPTICLRYFNDTIVVTQMDQQDYRIFFIMSTLSDLPYNSQ
jgi:hypothetical protein